MLQSAQILPDLKNLSLAESLHYYIPCIDGTATLDHGFEQRLDYLRLLGYPFQSLMNYYLGIAEVKYLRHRGNGRINLYWRKASKIKENALY